MIDEATLQGVHSGNLELSLDVHAKGSEGGNLNVSLSGPFQSEGEGSPPELDLTVKAKGSINGEDVNFEGGLVLLPNTAYVSYEGTDYEVDPTTFSFLKSAIKRLGQSGEETQSAGSSGCQEVAGKLKVADFVDNLSNDGSSDVGGTSTTKVSGDLNIPGGIEALMELAEDPACSAQLNATGAFPPIGELEKAKGTVEDAVKVAHVDLYVGEDHIVRRASAQLTIEPSAESAEGPESVELSLDLLLTGVNEGQEISAPQGAKPLNDLFQKLGVNPLELAGALSGEGGLGGVLEGLGGANGGGSVGGSGSSGGAASGGEVPSVGGQQAYVNCLRHATSPVDLQKCAALLK
ncbi:MAG: hypothetical protein WBM00_01915 [Solirubrobacterales bacterium]